MSKKNVIEEQTNSLINSFAGASRDLFEVTNRGTENFEQGLYGFAIAKPSRRMKSALAIDREVLVVTSTFRDQQQRTKFFDSSCAGKDNEQV